MCKHRDKLFAQFRDRALLKKRGFSRSQFPVGIEMFRDKVGKKSEHANRFRRIEPGWTRIDGAQSTKKGIVRQDDRHGDIALESIHSRGRMSAPVFLFRYV